MTSQRQIEANRRNALLSTGPITENGKQQSRCNAYRHGLVAETVIAGAEDAAEYVAFEAQIVEEYDPKSIVERELTRRLASLLWRLRRANLIETGLLTISSVRHSDRPQSIASCFLRLTNLSGQPLERINRHETRLWRQFVQVLFALDQAKYHRIAASRGRFTPHAPQW